MVDFNAIQIGHDFEFEGDTYNKVAWTVAKCIRTGSMVKFAKKEQVEGEAMRPVKCHTK